LFQPATNYWRAIELTVLIEQGLPHLRSCGAFFDLGCGDGEIMRLLKPHLPPRAKITGVDVDPEETALAQASGVYDRVLCSGADHVGIPDASQDAIISNSVLEHVGPIREVLAESARLLKPSGWFVATVPAPGFHKCLKGSWRANVSRDAYLREMDERLVHHRYWTQDEWREHLASVGIEMISCLPYLSQAQTQRWELLTRLTGGLLYYLTGGKKRPITLQRQMGVRRRMVAPLWLVWPLAWLVGLGAQGDISNDVDRNACFLILGRKA